MDYMHAYAPTHFSPQTQLHSAHPQNPQPFSSGPQAQSLDASQQPQYPGSPHDPRQHPAQVYNHGVGSFNAHVANGGYQQQQQQQQQLTGQPYPYTSGPHTQPFPATTAPTPAPPLLVTPAKQSVSPPLYDSAYATPYQQSQQPRASQTPQRGPMAAPPLPQPRPSAQPEANNSAQTSPSVSSGDLEREKERMALLLDINNDLLQELMALYTSGKGGATSLQQKAVLESHGMPSEMASEEYIA
ncbi:hypothetical protein LTR50_005326 [Elasticomyces elasticus]|nr:hypothetical protein LTR50_005326 [Elasticomyces elasticus]